LAAPKSLYVVHHHAEYVLNAPVNRSQYSCREKT